jgi:hypothetical protein
MEAILKQHLRPVSAPAELGERVLVPSGVRPGRGPHKPKKHNSMRLAWASAGLILVASSAFGLHSYLGSALANKPRHIGQAADAVRLREWVRSSTGLDIHGACRVCHDGEEQMTAFN